MALQGPQGRPGSEKTGPKTAPEGETSAKKEAYAGIHPCFEAVEPCNHEGKPPVAEKYRPPTQIMDTRKIKTAIAAAIIILIYLIAASIVFREQVEQRVNLYECPLCGQLVR